ncbi:MAG TPA: biotin carboxylase N-terminal domain-containing protein [Thermoanaerobaculia bacterium]|nr:biotin carboxylase N-terminal domain-containing protein [Thermoanaerobaculia bacterium]
MSRSTPERIDPILVANRGEISVRILRTVRALGYRSVAVFSDADRHAPHVELADEAVRLGPAPARESYLSIERLLEAARATGARSVHPGYGFLAENAAFARACAGAGLVFIGPSAEAIETMGDKGEAKRRMLAAGVPCVPGFHEPGASDEVLLAAAEEVGFPLMVKAAAGGGGRGMRRVERAADVQPAITVARSEALGAFGSEELILERAIRRPRHVEIQVLADAHGHVIHLGERDCSVQRRHQKVIEESPCPVMTRTGGPELRERMGEAAVAAAKSIGYVNAGTVEFLLDEAGEFWFLEVNTRLQVEHPVTEMVTGLDLVALQIAIAEGRPLELRQEDMLFDGHAIEARLYAEDPARGFLPASGRIACWREAQLEGLRIDAGVASGQHVSADYDPLLAKVIAWGRDREQARRRLVDGLAGTALFGVASNRGFLIECLEHDTFVAGEATTAFLEETRIGEPAAGLELDHDRDLSVAGAVLVFLAARDTAHARSLIVSPQLLDWGSSGLPRVRQRYRFAAGEAHLSVLALGRDRYQVDGRVDGEDVASEVEVLGRSAPDAELRIDGRRRRVLHHVEHEHRVHVSLGARTATFENLAASVEAVGEAQGGGRVVAPMHGTVVEVYVAPGDEVSIGMRIATVEAMKMQHELLAEVDGVVAEIAVEDGQQVAAGDLIAVIEDHA